LSSSKPTAWKRLLAEGLVIVVGVLVALFVDGIREERVERRMLAESLGDLALEIGGNSETLRRVQEFQIPPKLHSLERVIRVLRGDDPVADTAGFNRAPAVLIGMADEIRGDYRKVVHEILSPELAPELSQLEGYVPGSMRDPAWFEGSADSSA